MKKIFLFLSLCTLIFTSCEDEPIGEIQVNNDIVDVVLLNYMKLVTDDPSSQNINCIEFNYSFTIFTFDAEMNFVEAQAVFNNGEFLTLLNGLTKEQSISLNFPIAGTLHNGELMK